MKERSYSATVLRSARSDPSGSCGGFKLSAKLRARMKKLERWRICPSSIKSPKGTRQFHGGHATVSKAFLLDDNPEDRWYFLRKSYKPTEVMQLCRQSLKSNDRIREAADHRRDAEEKLHDEEEHDEEQHGSDSDERWHGQFVAVKKSRIGDNKDLERVLGLALREMEFLVELFHHPNIVKFKGFVEDLSKDTIWLVFPWAKEGNLKDFVASRDWEIPERISLINDVASGLEYLHSQKPPICHGDLKSYNVLVNSENRAVITDFGSARRLNEHDLNKQPMLVQNQQQLIQAMFSTSSKTITLTGNIYTLRWAAPELLNYDQVSLWSDIWALGWIAYEVLTNSIPFQDVPADAVVVERVIQGDLPSIDENARVSLFKVFCSLMTRCWNSNPSERPTATDCLRAMSDMPMVIPNATHSEFLFTSPSEVLMKRGREACAASDLGMALACFTEAHGIYTRIDDRQSRADALCSLASVHRLRKDHSEAIALYSEALQIRTDVSDKRGRADALWGLAEVHRVQNEYSDAIELYSEALQIRTDIGDKRGRADALWGLAEVNRVRKKYDEAIALYSKALQVRTDINDKRGIADTLWGLAEVHLVRNEHSEAMAHYTEVLEIRTAIGDKQGRANALWGLAEAHRIRREYSKAFALYFEDLQVRTDIGDKRGRANALWGLAEVLRLRYEYRKAIVLYSQCLQIYIGIDDKEGRADALEGLADIHRRQGHHADATSLYEQAAELFEQSGNGDAAVYALKKAADTRQQLKLVAAV